MFLIFSIIVLAVYIMAKLSNTPFKDILNQTSLVPDFLNPMFILFGILTVVYHVAYYGSVIIFQIINFLI